MVAAASFKSNNPLKPGMEVIVPAVSWATTYYPLHQYGLKLKFVDIDTYTLNYDLTALERAITRGTVAIMVVHLLGNPNDMKKIMTLAKEHNLMVLEDNCESMGATYKSKYTGTFGLMGTMSLFFSHHLSTMEGGMILTDDEEMYQLLLCLRAHGWTRNLPDTNLITGKKSPVAFEESFKFVLPGYNVRPLEICGAIGQIQLNKLRRFILQRRKNARMFLEAMKEFPWIITQKQIGCSSAFGFSMVLRDTAPVSRGELVEIFASAGIQTRPIVAGNFTKNEVIKYFNYTISGELTGADTIDKNGLFIGNHHYELYDEIAMLVRTLRSIERKNPDGK